VAADDVRVRRAVAGDLQAALHVWYATERSEDLSLPPLALTTDALRHDVEAGDMFVAERGGVVVGFATSFARDGVRFLSNLFVHPDEQSAGIGGRLLAAAMPHDGVANCTMSSKDPRAIALYVRHGMPPRWPHVLLEADASSIGLPDRSDVAARAADPDDPELCEWDREIAGRARPVDLDHLVSDLEARAFWFERHGRRIGYGFIQGRSPFALRQPDQVMIGPVGVRDPADAAPCVLEAVRRAAELLRPLALGVPGPHPALPDLLRTAFRIAYVELFMAGSDVVDPARYVASGSEVF